MKISRRDFCAHSSGLLFSFAPLVNIKPLLHFGESGSNNLSTDENIVVVIHLAGGNDWFNTIIPYNDAEYYKKRPSLAIGAHKVLRLNEELAFNPALSELKAAYDDRQLAIFLNCKSEKHDLSHHKAIRQMQYLSTATEFRDIWQARHAKQIASGDKNRSFPGFNVQPLFYSDDRLSGELKSKEKVISYLLNKANSFEYNLDAHYLLGNGVADIEEYREGGFQSALLKIAHLIKNRTNSNFYHLSLGGFDTHENQLQQHQCLLELLSRGLGAFRKTLKKDLMADRVLIVVCSEFGRDLAENENGGTDHGYVSYALVMGTQINDAICGGSNLLKVDNTIAYEYLWSTLFERWWACSG